MSLDAIIILTCLAALAGFWWQSDKVKRLALIAVQHRCRLENLQLLDQTLVLKGLWPVRNQSGSLVLRRHYHFEFTSTGEVRHQGTITLHGARLISLHLDPYILPNQQEQLH